ncbi:hypothetical protein [Altererythrobacter sp. MF3-039]|uniref:hypothetical protein n=1 Tax=Altererythrobacter sp. MF3-039 TaxID=3252901 RepID=UPI00390C76D9
MRALLLCLASVCVSFAAPTIADEPPSPRAIIERALAAHGGDHWLDPGTLVLSGHAEFYDPKTGEVRSCADDYRMWREMDPGRTVAHGADGKVRIVAKSGDRVIFEVGYDGETTWTQDGILPKAQADAYWATNFGFGIIRSALNEGFTLERAPPRDISGHMVELVRIIDLQGQRTLFGFDTASGFIRYIGFDSPRGWHERTYDDFVRLPESGWVQAREVTLFYDGVKSNTVYWREVETGVAVDPLVFTPPQENE